jgi:hypothetical protein
MATTKELEGQNLDESFLPENNEELLMQTKHKENKLKEFREYLVDKEIVLSFTTFLLSLRNKENKSSDPINTAKKYFGQ